MRLPAITDTSGRKSHTLFFVTLSMFTVLGSVWYGLYIGKPYDLGQIGTAVMTILAPLVAREWVKPAGVV